MRLRAAAFAFAAVLSGGAPTPAQAQAQCAGFVDVAGSDTACAGITWIKNRGITLGCAIANSFCPNETVNRMQMALFMNRLGNVMSPVGYGAEASGTTLDLTNPVFICQTSVAPAANYQRTFAGEAGFSYVATGTGGIVVSIVASLDGGPFAKLSGGAHSSISGAGSRHVSAISQNATVSAGATHQYAIRVASTGVPIALTSWTCNLQSELHNLN